MIFSEKNITAITHERVKGGVKAWHNKTSMLLYTKHSDCITGKNPEGDLLFFWRSPNSNWKVSNVSAMTNTPIASAPTGGNYKKQIFSSSYFLSASDAGGNLFIFHKQFSAGWDKTNISAQTGQKVVGAVTSWQEKIFMGLITNFYLAGVNPQGEVLVFKEGSANKWDVINISTQTGEKINSPLTAWVTQNGAFSVPHLAGHNSNGDLLVFWRQTSGIWRVVNVTVITGRKVDGPLTSWITKNDHYTVEHLAGRGPNGELLTFWWSPQHDWQVVDVSYISCGVIQGTPSNYQLTEDGENIEMLASRTHERRLLLHWWRPSTDWQMLDATAAHGTDCFGDPSCWRGSQMPRAESTEYIAFEANDYQLHVLIVSDIPRKMLKSLAQPFTMGGGSSVMKYARKPLNLLTILWNWNPPLVNAPTKAQVDDWVYGSVDSVNDYLKENSREHFKLHHAGTVGWYNSDYPAEWYAESSDPNEDFGNRHHRKYMEAVRNAWNDFNFQTYDANGDGKLQTSECGILLIVPGNKEGGYVRDINLKERPTAMKYSQNGIEFTEIAEVYVLPISRFGLIAHELIHLLLGHGDMYFDFISHSRAGEYSLMDAHFKGQHLDPFAKLKYGWVCPHLILRNGTYTLADIETNHQILILMDPNHNLNEYFIIENRWAGSSYDQNMSAQGLGVWHIMETPQLFNSALPPKNVNPAFWNAMKGGNETRLAIRMIRPVLTIDDKWALWDGANSSTGYDLLSSDPDPTHNELRWGDGTPSGFAIRNISEAGPSMTLTVEVPF